MSDCSWCMQKIPWSSEDDWDGHRKCGSCGYPLRVGNLLERIRKELPLVTEVLRMSFAEPAPRPRPMRVIDAVAFLRAYEDLTFPEYEDRDVVAISIVDELLIFNFGARGNTRQMRLPLLVGKKAEHEPAGEAPEQHDAE